MLAMGITAGNNQHSVVLELIHISCIQISEHKAMYESENYHLSRPNFINFVPKLKMGSTLNYCNFFQDISRKQR
jgi:hypothetical protein